MSFRNTVEFKVYGDYALFSDPSTRIGGEKFTTQVPSYEALKGILHSIYFKPTITWIIDECRVMNKIQMETKGIRPIKYYSPKNDLSYYTYLKDVEYQVRAHFIWNMNRPELEADRNEHKHHNIAKRMIEHGGRRDIFLGTRECQGYVEPCVFGEGKGEYDDTPEISYGIMYHGITYADEAYSEETEGHMSVRLAPVVMKNGIIAYEKPGNCIHRVIKEMRIKPFGKELCNFTGNDEFDENGEAT